MADSEVSVRFTSKEEAALWQSFVKLSSSFAKAKQGASDTAKATGDLDKSLKAFAEREIKLDTTPWQAMLTQVGKLDAALKAGMLTPEQHAAAHARAVAKMRDAYGQVKPVEMRPVTLAAAAGPSEELRKFAEQTRRINATPLERYQATMLKLNEATRAGVLSQEDFRRAAKSAQEDYQRELDASARKTRGVTDAARDSAGGVAGAFGSMLTRVGVSVTGLTALAYRVFDEIRAQADKSAQDVTASYKSLGKLGQIGGANLTAERRKMAEEYYQTGAVGSMSEAADVIFSLANNGALGDRKIFADLQKTGLVADPAEMTKMAAQLRQTLGAGKAGTNTEILARAMVAAEPVDTTPDALIRAAAKSGQAAGDLGLTAPELMAATTTMIKAKGEEEGGTYLASFMAKLNTLEGVSGTGLWDRIASIQQKDMSPAELKKFFGDDSSVQAFGILSGAANETKALSGRVAAATPDILSQKVNEQMANEDVAVGVESAAQRARAEVANKQLGLRTLRADITESKGVEEIRQRGFSAGGRRFGAQFLFGEAGRDIDAGIASAAAKAARFIPGIDASFAGAENAGRPAEETRKRQQATDDQAAAAKELREAAEQLKASVRPRGPSLTGPARRDQAVEAQ